MPKEIKKTQRQTEWLELSEVGIEYHKKQFQETYRSTIAFCEWLDSYELFNSKNKINIADIGAGAGSNLYYMSKKYSNLNLTGIELNRKLISIGNEFFNDNNINNCILQYGDLYNIDKSNINAYNGIVSYQTLSWLPEYKIPLKKIATLNPDWIAISSLFYNGEVDLRIEIKDYSRPGNSNPYKEGFYNIYPLPHVKNYFKKLGYSKFEYLRFDIDIDLPKPQSKGMATYTEMLKNGRRIQISGGILMNWYFVLARK